MSDLDERKCSFAGCDRKHLARGWCLRHYTRVRRYGDPGAGFDSYEDRFWAKVDRDGPIPEACPELGPCWEWTACRTWFGYGHIRSSGGGRDAPMLMAHRVSWEMARGPIPDGLLALHRCDNPPCVNPDHLFLGTHADNARDKWAKGRGVIPGGQRA